MLLGNLCLVFAVLVVVRTQPECYRLQTEARTCEMIYEQDSLLKQMKAEMETIKGRQQDMETRLEACACGSDPKVSFTGKDVTNFQPTTNERLRFNTTLRNDGNGFDRTTGIFIVPSDGVYIFTTQLCVNSRKWLAYAFVADTVTLKRGWFHDNDVSTCGSADVIAELTEGTKVWISVEGQAGATLYNSEKYWNSFSGLKIRS